MDGLALGELVGELEANGQLLGVPVASFLVAFAETRPTERHRLIELAADPSRATVLLSLAAEDALPVASLLALHALETAQCIVEAQNRQIQLATYRPAEVVKSLDPALVLELIEP